jgi:hypothetical protein
MAGAVISATVPQAWHSPQRPDHFVVRQPHSAQRNADAADDFPMARTVAAGYDNALAAYAAWRSRPGPASTPGPDGAVVHSVVGRAA